MLSVGAGVSTHYAGQNVAIYRSLTPSPYTVGLWSELALVPYTSCVILPDSLDAQDYSGSLVNVITAYAFLEEIAAEGQTGVIVTAGSSATGLAMAALAQERNTPALFLVRSSHGREALRNQHVLTTSDDDFDAQFQQLAEKLKTTAVFDGIGGELISRLAPNLPANASVSFYGFLGGNAPIAVPTAVFMTKNLTMKRFSNFNSATVRNPQKLHEALYYLQERIGNPLFRTKVGKTFSFDQIHDAMAYEAAPGAKAVLLAKAAGA